MFARLFFLAALAALALVAEVRALVPVPAPKPVGVGKSSTAKHLIQVNRNDLPGVMSDELWDPLGLSSGASDRTLKRWRESELKHGRVGESSLAVSVFSSCLSV